MEASTAATAGTASTSASSACEDHAFSTKRASSANNGRFTIKSIRLDSNSPAVNNRHTCPRTKDCGMRDSELRNVLDRKHAAQKEATAPTSARVARGSDSDDDGDGYEKERKQKK